MNFIEVCLHPVHSKIINTSLSSNWLLFLASLIVWLQVIEHVHDTVIRVVAITSKELLDQDFKAFKSGCRFQDID